MQKSKKPKNSAKLKKIASQRVSESEFDKKVLELAEQGLTSEKIGESLRKLGIHPKEHNKRISKILKGSGNYINPDLKNIEAKLEKVKKHFEKNRQDRKSMREKERIFSHLRKTKEYFETPLK